MNGDPWTLIISGAVVALITYALPKLIEGMFRRRVTFNEVEAAQEELEARRWKKVHDDLAELDNENRRLRSLLRAHNIDPNDTGPLGKLPDKPHDKPKNGLLR